MTQNSEEWLATIIQTHGNHFSYHQNSIGVELADGKKLYGIPFERFDPSLL